MSVWDYYEEVFNLALRETMGTFGWTMTGFIAAAIALTVGALLHWRLKGWPHAKDELGVFVMYTLAPYATMMLLVTLFNLAIAPRTLYTNAQQDAIKAKEDKSNLEAQYTTEIAGLKGQLRDITKPEFVLETTDILCIEGPSKTSALLSMRIANRGADSAVFGYKITYTSPRAKETATVVHLSKPFVRDLNGGRISVTPSTTLDHLASRPIRRGGYVDGRLALVIPGQHAMDITDGIGAITIEVQDYLGNSYSTEFRGTGQSNVVKRLFGEPIE